jgi:hypothetical protein
MKLDGWLESQTHAVGAELCCQPVTNSDNASVRSYPLRSQQGPSGLCLWALRRSCIFFWVVSRMDAVSRMLVEGAIVRRHSWVLQVSQGVESNESAVYGLGKGNKWYRGYSDCSVGMSRALLPGQGRPSHNHLSSAGTGVIEPVPFSSFRDARRFSSTGKPCVLPSKESLVKGGGKCPLGGREFGHPTDRSSFIACD